MIFVSYFVLMPPIFEFSEEPGPSSNLSPTRDSLFSSRFRRGFFLVSLVSLILLPAGNILWKLNRNSAKTEISPPLKKASPRPRPQAVSLPPLLVSLKGERGIRMARVHVNLEVNRLSAKKEILSNKTATQKQLLILLSGKKSRDMKDKKSYFENRLLSWMNAFLSRGSVNKVTIQTTLLN